MKQFALRLLGAALASPTGVRAIRAWAFRDPARHLFDLDGGLYMARWHVIREDSLASRVLEKLTGYSSIRLHRIMRYDKDRDLHNHPFSYRTFVLQGFYAEERQAIRDSTLTQWLRSGDTASTDAASFHRIADVSCGGVWTLFCMTRNTGTWGFSVDGQFIDSRTYFKIRGFDRTNPQ